MRCTKCGYSAESLGFQAVKAKEWYEETAKSLRVCPSCLQQSYAISYYDEKDMNALKDKLITNNVSGAWFCTLDLNLKQVGAN